VSKRRPKASYSKPHAAVHQMDQKTCRGIALANKLGRDQAALLSSKAAKSAAKGLCVFDEADCRWKLTPAGIALANGPDVEPMVN
jgi:hypothetical protein